MTLPELVAGLAYKPGWRFALIEAPSREIWWPRPGVDLVFMLEYAAADSSDPARIIPIQHQFDVPPAPAGSWERWLLDRILDAEHHEAMEFFTVSGRRPFYPIHDGPGGTLLEDLYAIRERECQSATSST